MQSERDRFIHRKRMGGWGVGEGSGGGDVCFVLFVLQESGFCVFNTVSLLGLIPIL